MYRSKKGVDKHVEALITKLPHKEFKSRAYSIARLYYEVGDYVSCQKYVEQYLCMKDNNAAAHKLMGQALQQLGEKEKALEQFKASLDIDPSQTSLILDICELLADDEILVDPGRAKYWCEKAEAIFPRNPITFRLREKLMVATNPDPEALSMLLTAELAIHPKDVTLHIRLLRHYIETNNVKNAFEHICIIEFARNNHFVNHYTWYETVLDVIQLPPPQSDNWKYHLLFLIARERLCILSLTEIPYGTSKSLSESCNLLHLYDQAIESVARTKTTTCAIELFNSVLHHHRGQFAFYAAIFLLKKAKKDQLSWREAFKASAPLMLIAWHTISIDKKMNWVSQSPQEQQIIVSRWYLDGCYRYSQAGHFLLANMKNKAQTFLDNISQYCSGPHWRDKLYERLFMNRDYLAKTKTSHFVSDAVGSPTLRLPRKAEVEAYDADAQIIYPNSLHHLIWILLNYKNYATFKCSLFDTLSPKSSNYPGCGPETLNKYDVYAFLFCTAFTAQQQLKKNQQSVLKINDALTLLPANITDLLCSLPQMKWFDCAYKLNKNELGTELTDIRSTLSRGIEVVRCIDNHGLDAELLCLLGRIFNERSKETTVLEDKNHLENRAKLYYVTALPLLEKMKSNVYIKIPEKRLFDYVSTNMTPKELNSLIEESKFFLGVIYIKENEYENASAMLSNLKSAEANYHLSHMYKNMAIETTSSSNVEHQSKCASLLVKAKNYAYIALQMSQTTYDDFKPLFHADLHQLIEDIEINLNKIDANLSNDADSKCLSDEDGSVSSDHVAALTNNSSHVFRNISSTPKINFSSNASLFRNAKESHFHDVSQIDQKYFERIEKQIRNLQKRDSSVNTFMDQTKGWIEENRNLGNEVRDMKNKLADQIINSINANINSTIDQFKLLKISVDQVKDQIGDYRNECKVDVGDLKKQVTDLKKEVNKLKRASSEQTDLYNLNEDYRNNDSTSTFAAAQLPFTPPQMIAPFNQRIVPPVPIPTGPYPLYGQNLYNFYNQYSQLSQPAPPGVPSLFDAARPPINYPPMYPPTDSVYADVAHLIPPNVVPPVTISSSSIISSTSKSTLPSHNKEPSRSMPANVVITSSDPLPTNISTIPPPILSVTIPPEHIKGTPHNYQIAMPTNETQVNSPGIFPSTKLVNNMSVATMSKPFTGFNQSSSKTTASLNSSPKISSIIENSLFSLFESPKPDLFKVGSSVTNASTTTPNSSLNKSRTLSEKSNTSVENYDPFPEFKPIVPLPAEVKITTGEEDESTVFSARAKLFRFIDKQWKERGIGEMKLLKHKVTGKVRVLMRREQIHKVCANHIITPDMQISPMKNETKSYFWAANDFADEAVVLEKFCIRFKTPDIAKQFYEAFEKARIDAETRSKLMELEINKSLTNNSWHQNKNFGGFTFSNSPIFKDVKQDDIEHKPVDERTNKINPFSSITLKSNQNATFTDFFKSSTSDNLSWNQETAPKLNVSDTLEDFEPTTEFKPVVSLPALIDQKTGEEDQIVLFEHRAKLLRFDSTNKEWKERGLGNIKLLVNKDNNQKIRLLMRREQVMKVCCNHALTKDLSFQKMPNFAKAVTWCAKDYSEGEFLPETFCLRFKTEKACNDFIEAVNTAQSNIKDNIRAAKEEQNEAKLSSQGSIDKFPMASDSWFCVSCYTNNLDSFTKCACCELPRSDSVKDKPKITKDVPVSVSNWGDHFKPKAGTWECPMCFVRNEGNVEKCCCCNTSKEPSELQSQNTFLPNVSPKFSFGIPQTKTGTFTNDVTSEPSSTLTWGDKFKPKAGTWECMECFVRNESHLDQCCACNSPKNEGILKKEPKQLLNNETAPKFTFGMPAQPIISEKPKGTSASIFDGTGTHKFTFGISTTSEKDKVFSFNYGVHNDPLELDKGILNLKVDKSEGSLNSTTCKPALLPTPLKHNSPFGQTITSENKAFGFVFKPKTNDKEKSPMTSPKADKNGGDDEDNECPSEDEGHHIHFSPVIPMPDKVAVITGEEDELVLYDVRAKLYCYVGSEFKECGRGIVKLLKHKTTGKLRILMRREQVLKVCLNHALTAETNYLKKDEKSWLFAVHDLSDNEVSLQKFCIRFKNKEIALEFKNAIDKARENLNKKENYADDVAFISEVQSTPEDQQRAELLMLPKHFYNYKVKEPCQGCAGCKDEDYDENVYNTTPGKKVGFSLLNNSQSSVYGTPTAVNKSFETSIFGTPLQTPAPNNVKFQISNKSVDDSFTLRYSDKDKTLVENKSLETSIFGTPSQTPAPNSVKFQLSNKSVGDSFTLLYSDKDKTLVENKNLGTTNQQLNNQRTPQSNIFESDTISDEKSLSFTKGSILAAPKLTSINQSSDKENQLVEVKSIFGCASPLQSSSDLTNAKSLFGSFNKFENKSTANLSLNSSLFLPSSSNNKEESPKPTNESDDQKSVGVFSKTTPFGTSSPFTINSQNISGDKSVSSTESIFSSGTMNKDDNIFKAKSIFANSYAQSTSSVLDSKNDPIIEKKTGSDAENKDVINDSVDKNDAVRSLEKKNDEASEKVTLFDSSLSFAALSTSAAKIPIQKKENFKWEGAGQQLFIKPEAQSPKDKSKNISAEGDMENVTEEYDPHYEPIVPLPDEIVVKTGEEDEEKLYSQRCKLYRYDEQRREWKERGVGEIKILYHPQKKTYRLLLRREQVHKAVLNMLLFMDLQLLPMKNSDRAWTWAGRNYAENVNGDQETLSVRFKTVALANIFFDKVTDCVRKLQAAAAQAIRDSEAHESNTQFFQVSSSTKYESAESQLEEHNTEDSNQTVNLFSCNTFPESSSATSFNSAPREYIQEYRIEEVEPEEQDDDEDLQAKIHFGEYEGYEEYEDYNEENFQIYCSCECEVSIQQGNKQSSCAAALVQVVHDKDLYTPKILVTDNASGEILVEMIIHSDIEFQVDEDESTCSWSGTDYTSNDPEDKSVVATFPDSVSCHQFHTVCHAAKLATFSSVRDQSA